MVDVALVGGPAPTAPVVPPDRVTVTIAAPRSGTTVAGDGFETCPRVHLGGSGAVGDVHDLTIHSATADAVTAFEEYRRTVPPDRCPGPARMPDGALERARVELVRG